MFNDKTINIGDILYRLDYHLSDIRYRITELPAEEKGMNGLMRCVCSTEPEKEIKHDYSYTLYDIGKALFLTPEEAKEAYERRSEHKSIAV